MIEFTKRQIKSRDVYTAEFSDDLEVSFHFNGTSIFSEGKNLIYESIKEIDTIDGALEINRYIRPDVLTIQGILCFFSGYPYTVYEKSEGQMTVINRAHSEMVPTKLIINGVEYTEDLKKLLHSLNDSSKRPLIISLLDRWRKARYMDNESEVNTYHDEAILAYFHILELITTEYYDEFKSNAEAKINSFLNDYCSNILKHVGSQLNEVVLSKHKILKEILIKDEVSISTKIYHFLEKCSMLDEKTYALVSRLLKVRNSIAHGRTIFRDKFIWPLPPFFNSTNESHLVISEISIFTARIIATHLGLEAWKKQWEEIYDVLPPTDASIRNFIRDIQDGSMSVKTEELMNGKHNFITPSILTSYYIENINKYNLSQFDLVLGNAVLQTVIDEENAEHFFLASILLADSDNKEVSTKSKSNVEIVHKNNWCVYSNIKDILRYLNYYDVQPAWFRTWLEEGRQEP